MVLFFGQKTAVKLRYIRWLPDAEVDQCASPDLNKSARCRGGVVWPTWRISLVSPEYANRA